MAHLCSNAFLVHIGLKIVKHRNKRNPLCYLFIVMLLFPFVMFFTEERLIDTTIMKSTFHCSDELILSGSRHTKEMDRPGIGALKRFKSSLCVKAKVLMKSRGSRWKKSWPKTIVHPLGRNKSSRLRVAKSTVLNGKPTVPEVLIVVLAIPDYPWFAAIAKESHERYASRHGYRLVVQRNFQGPETGRYKGGSSLQKLLACRHARGEKYVLILDYDVVIAPWAHALHTDEAVENLGSRVGIVDESQPSAAHVAGILKHVSNMVRIPSKYYESYGFPGLNASRGILNTGVMLVQPALHGKIFETMFYKHVEPQKTKYRSRNRFFYEQALIGAELMRNGMDGELHHAWNRGWSWYKWSQPAGFEKYEIGDVFRRSYFLHFYFVDKREMVKLRNWMHSNNVTFDDRSHKTMLP